VRLTLRIGQLGLALMLVVPAMTAWLGSGDGAVAQPASGLSPQEKRGKQIFLKGEGGERAEIKATLNNGELEMPASAFPCANCHGLRGEGTKEGGLQPPPLVWAALTSPAKSALTGRERGPYTETSLKLAISLGLDPSGAKLHSGMPRYRMTLAQMSDLIAYLKKLGQEADADPGVGEDLIKVGAALPLTGPLQRIGEDVKLVVAAYFTEINSRGGIYGRKFELVTADSRGDQTGTLEATRRLVEQDGVFALVASFEPKGSHATREFLRSAEVPLIGPVTLSPGLPAVPNRYLFYLLPSFGDQARSLVDFIASGAPPLPPRRAERIAIIYADGEFDRDALASLRSQAKRCSLEIVSEQRDESDARSAAAIVESLAPKKPDYIFFFGSAENFVSLARELDRLKLEAGLLSSSVMVGRDAFSLPPSVAARTYLAYPASLPERDDFSEFTALIRSAGIKLRSAAFQALAYAAARILVEAVRASGRPLSRAALIGSLEQLQNFKTGVAPPVTFNPNRRVGATGSYIVGIDLAHRRYVELTDRLVPKE